MQLDKECKKIGLNIEIIKRYIVANSLKQTDFSQFEKCHVSNEVLPEKGDCSYCHCYYMLLSIL